MKSATKANVDYIRGAIGLTINSDHGSEWVRTQFSEYITLAGLEPFSEDWRQRVDRIGERASEFLTIDLPASAELLLKGEVAMAADDNPFVTLSHRMAKAGTAISFCFLRIALQTGATELYRNIDQLDGFLRDKGIEVANLEPPKGFEFVDMLIKGFRENQGGLGRQRETIVDCLRERSAEAKRFSMAAAATAITKEKDFIVVDADIVEQLASGKIDEDRFQTLAIQLCVRAPKLAVYLVWSAAKQGVDGATDAWESICMEAFGSADPKVIMLVSPAFNAVREYMPKVFKKIPQSAIMAEDVDKETLRAQLHDVCKRVFMAKRADVDAALNGDAESFFTVFIELLAEEPLAAAKLSTFMKLEYSYACRAFVVLHYSIQVERYMHAWNSKHRKGFMINEKALAAEAEAEGEILDGDGEESDDRLMVIPAPGMPDTGGRSTGSKLSSERRKNLQPYQHLRTGVQMVVPEISPDELAHKLLTEFPWMSNVVTLIKRDMETRQAYGHAPFAMPPLLLVGPPGTGKSRFAGKLAKYLGIPHHALSVAGASDDRMLRGTGSGWANATPCWPVVMMAEQDVANPLLLIDELDKVKAGGTHGDPRATLLTFLESENAKHFMDEALMTNVDISTVNWIATANEAKDIPMPLLNRFRVVEVEAPDADDVVAIVRGVREDFADEVGVDVRFIPALDEVEVAYLEKEFAKSPNVRVLIRMVQKLIHRREAMNREMPH